MFGGFFCIYSLSSGFCATTADVYHAASPFMTSISWMLGWCRYILGICNVFNLSSLWLLQCSYLIVEGAAFCCSMWLRKNMCRAVAGSESFRLGYRRMNKRPCGGNRRAAARQLAREMRVRQRCRLRKCLLCLVRSCGLANETPAMCRAVCAET